MGHITETAMMGMTHNTMKICTITFLKYSVHVHVLVIGELCGFSTHVKLPCNIRMMKK